MGARFSIKVCENIFVFLRDIYKKVEYIQYTKKWNMYNTVPVLLNKISKTIKTYKYI